MALRRLTFPPSICRFPEIFGGVCMVGRVPRYRNYSVLISQFLRELMFVSQGPGGEYQKST